MKKLIAICFTVLILFVLTNKDSDACPKCNADFRQELLDKRANTLGGQELLEAIKNQDGANSVVLPKKYVNQDEPLSESMKQIMAENERDTTPIITFDMIKLFFTTWVFRS